MAAGPRVRSPAFCGFVAPPRRPLVFGLRPAAPRRLAALEKPAKPDRPPPSQHAKNRRVLSPCNPRANLTMSERLPSILRVVPV